MSDITPGLKPAQQVLADLGPEASEQVSLIVSWFALQSRGEMDNAWKMMDPAGCYFLLRQRKTITLGEFGRIMDGLVGTTFSCPIEWSLGTITAQDDRVAVLAGSRVPLVAGGHYENLYHFLFRIDGGLIREGYEFGDTFRSAQTFAAPPGES